MTIHNLKIISLLIILETALDYIKYIVFVIISDILENIDNPLRYPLIIWLASQAASKMKRILYSDWPPQRMGQHCPPGVALVIPQEKKCFCMIIKLDCSKWMNNDLIVVLFSFWIFTDKENAKKDLGQYPAILSEQA